MEPLSKIKRFVENDSYNRECEDFSYTLFENIDFSKKEKNYSFFRSDFRGARFVNVIFNKNNFDRADFISCSFENCKFLNVDILACEIKNSSFKEVSFIENNYDNTSIQECVFINCVFTKEKMLVNMKKTIFEKTIFNKCTFERSTTEELTFKSSQLNYVDLATMHAECHKFISCNLSDVKLGISYVYGYLYHDTDISKFEVLYRGKKVNLNSEQEALKLIEQNRIYEFFNILFIYKNYKIIPSFLHKALETIFNNYNHIYKLEMINMLKALQFHTLYNSLPYECIINCIEILQICKLTNLPLEDELEFISLKESIIHLIEDHKYNDRFIKTAYQSYAIVTLHIETEDITIATNISQNFFDEVCIKYGLHNNSTLVEKKKGSWILTFVLSAAIALLIPKVIKEYHDTLIDMQIKSQLVKQIVKKLQLNGYKHSVLFSNKKFIKKIEHNSVYTAGSLLCPQIEFIKKLYKFETKDTIINNINMIAKSSNLLYDYLKSLLLSSPLKLFECNEGFFCLLGIPRYYFPMMDDYNIAKEIFKKTNVLTIPHDRYLFYDKKYYTFRINLIQPQDKLFLAINFLNEYLYTLD